MLGAGIIPKLARSEDGFTLIEMLVAMITGLVVAGALFAILEVSLRQTSLITDRVQASQLGRTAMTKIVDELHSACLSSGFTPVQANSSATELRFIDAFSEEAVIPKASEHRLVWNEEKQTLTDYAYPSAGGEWPKFTFSGAPTPAAGTLLASRVTKTSLPTPIFQYYKYASQSKGTSEAEKEVPAGTLTPIELKSAETLGEHSKEAASVLINFTTAPTNNYTAESRSVPFSSQVTFALGAPSSEATIKDTPCQ